MQYQLPETIQDEAKTLQVKFRVRGYDVSTVERDKEVIKHNIWQQEDEDRRV